MKNHHLLFLGLFALLVASCSRPAPAPEATPDLYTQLTEESAYDSVFAAKLGSDDYGMKAYVMAFLKKGPNRDLDSLAAAELQTAHLKNIFAMAASGKLAVAGPFMDDGDIRGIYIFNVPTVEEARALTATDPAIQAGSLVMELHPWYGPATLPLLAPLSKRVEKQSIAE